MFMTLTVLRVFICVPKKYHSRFLFVIELKNKPEVFMSV